MDDILLPFSVPVKMLKVFGFWQNKSSTWAYFAFGIFMHIVFVDLYASLQFGYLFVFETFEDFINVMSLFPTCVALCFKSANLIGKIDEVEKLFEMLRVNLKSDEINYDFKLQLKTVDKIFKYYWGSALITCALGASVIFFQHELPYRMWFPYDHRNNELGFWLSATYQMIVSCSVCGVVVVIDMLPVIFMGYILAMLQQVCNRLESLKECEAQSSGEVGKKSNEKEFLLCILSQLTIMEVTRKVEDIFSTVLLAQGMMSSLILCTTAFALTIVSHQYFFS